MDGRTNGLTHRHTGRQAGRRKPERACDSVRAHSFPAKHNIVFTRHCCLYHSRCLSHRGKSVAYARCDRTRHCDAISIALPTMLAIRQS